MDELVDFSRDILPSEVIARDNHITEYLLWVLLVMGDKAYVKSCYTYSVFGQTESRPKATEALAPDTISGQA